MVPDPQPVDYSAEHAELHEGANYVHIPEENDPDSDVVYSKEIEVDVPAGGQPVDLSRMIQR